MIPSSDGPKTYWGYYQDFLVQIYGQKFLKKNPSIFSKNPKGIVMRNKNGRNGSGGRFSNLVQKLNERVQ